MPDTALHPATRPRRHPGHLALALALVTALGTLSACHPATDTAPAPTPAPTETRLAEPATFATAYDPDFEPGLLTTMASLGIIVSQETRTDAYGTWNPLTLENGASLLDIADGVVADDIDKTVWTDQALRQAWRLLANFLVTEWLDSELVWDDTPGNRNSLAGRLKTAGFFDVDAEGAPIQIGLLSPGESTNGVSRWGPFLVDQDFHRWRQTGTLVPDAAVPDPTLNEILRAQFQATIIPVEPAPYQLGQPRTLVGSFALTSVAVAADSPPTQAEFTVTMRHFRPVIVTATDVPVYEWADTTLTVQLRVEEGAPHFLGVRGFSGHRTDSSVISWDGLLRLPLLDRPTSGDAVSGRPQTVGHVTFDLPDKAEPGDSTCRALSSASDALSFSLPAASSAMPGCFWGQVYPSKSFHEWFLQPGTTTWSLAVGPLVGGIDISATDYGDDITMQFFDPGGSCYDLRATVPAGTGPDFAAQLVASLTYSAPEATSATTEQATATP